MFNARFKAIEESGKRSSTLRTKVDELATSNHFGAYVFNRSVMQRMLPVEVYNNIVNAMESKEKIKPEYADAVAHAMKEWAMSHGASYYTHWFQPLTGMSAEKHDSFLDWTSTDKVIEKFSGKQLIQGEPDASSFPSGGLRSTYEARGYTGWDPTSPVFLWRAGDGMTLCIPSVFFSWRGEVLDTKIPFLRSDEKINQAAKRLLKLTGIRAEHVYSTLGLEQEYFVIDRSLRNLRPDLILLGRTVFGASTSKGQELQDHYLGPVRDRVLAFMREFENEAIKLSIPVKTRHNEVAPAQYEVAPVFEKASRAIDHNLLLMELMKHVAVKHELCCLLHEKPFQGLNGSGKHSNWSLATDTGINLLDPSDTPGNNLHFIILITAILSAIHEHSALLRASIGSASNDYRLGGHEAPPAIMSVYLGDELEAIFENIEQKGQHLGQRIKAVYDLGLAGLPHLSKDNTDRNRTSPFAFTGNKFEFRAVGSSANPAFPITVLNAIVAESLNKMVDEIEAALPQSASNEELIKAAMSVVRKYLIASKPIRFSGDNYSNEWKKEAEKRKLPDIAKSLYAYEALRDEKTIKAFEGILGSQELMSRYEIMKENYGHILNIEMNLMLEMFRTQALPAAINFQKNLAQSIQTTGQVLESSKYLTEQIKHLKDLTAYIEEAVQRCEELEKARSKSQKLLLSERPKGLLEFGIPKAEAFREAVDQLEMFVDDQLWPIPKYRELLFVL